MKRKVNTLDGEKKKRSIIGRVMVFLLTLLALIGLVAMAVSVLSSYINPTRFVWASFFGLAFWEIFFFNFLIFFLLLLMRSRKAWVAVLALLISLPGLLKSYGFASKVEGISSLQVMSYNVHNFRHIDGKTNSEDFATDVIGVVKEQSPDVLCCQEFSSFSKGVSRPKCIELFAERAGFPYVYYNLKRNYGGNVVFSKYPLEKVSEDSGFGQENTYGIMVSVDAGTRGKFYVANMHLLSYSITDDEIDILMENNKDADSLESIGKSLVNKLRFAFERRSNEIDEVLTGMPEIDGPVIVCGDFNETPLSNVYHKMQKAGFNDSFIKVGRGIKPTYAGKLPLLRIDYVWTNDGVLPMRFSRIRHKASDHYPIVLEFSLSQDNNLNFE